MGHTEFPGNHDGRDVSGEAAHCRLNVAADLISSARAVRRMRATCAWLGLVESVAAQRRGGYLKITF